jgi:hypothetical protein
MTVEGGESTGRRVKVAKLQHILQTWAPYFFDGTTLEQAMRLVQQLTRALATESQKAVAAPLERWCAVSCVRSGIVGNLCMRSKNGRTLVRWSARKMSPYVTVAPMMATMFPPMMIRHGGGCGPCPNAGDSGISTRTRSKALLSTRGFGYRAGCRLITMKRARLPSMLPC